MLTSDFALKHLPRLVNWKTLHLRRKLTPELFINYGHKLNKSAIALVFAVTKDENDKALLIAATNAGVDATWIANRIESPLWYIKLFEDKINWDDLEVSDIDIKVLKNYKHKLKGKELTGKKLSFEYLQEFKKTLDWDSISMAYDLDKEYVDAFKDYLNWELLSKKPRLPVEMVKEYKDRLNLQSVLLTNPLTEQLWYKLALDGNGGYRYKLPEVSLSMYIAGRDADTWSEVWRKKFLNRNTVTWREFLCMGENYGRIILIASMVVDFK